MRMQKRHFFSPVYRELPPTKIKPNTRVSPFMIQMFSILFSCFFVQINTIFKLSCTLMKYSRILSFDLRFLLSDLWVEVCHFREPSGRAKLFVVESCLVDQQRAGYERYATMSDSDDDAMWDEKPKVIHPSRTR